MEESHLLNVLRKVNYFLLDNKVSILPIESERVYLKVGKHEVWINKETLDYSCTCTGCSLKKPCSHIIAAFIKLLQTETKRTWRGV